jgi:ribosomal protein S18 acetylase RimI-like enzyme
VGDTVSLRISTADGPADVVGVLLETRSEELVLRRRDGRVQRIDVTQVTTGRVVPPGPAQTIPVAELAEVEDRGWRPLEVADLGEWRLRAAGGFTRRANSALAGGDPGRPLADAVAEVADWYTTRSLPAAIQEVAPITPPPLHELLEQAGWKRSGAVHVMTAALGPVVKAEVRDGLGATDVRAAPDDRWLSAYRYRGSALPESAWALLTHHDNVAFVSIRDGDDCRAVARVAVDGRWAGLFAMEVGERHRRGGLGRAITVAALRWAVQQGARYGYLQVGADNAAAIGLYATLGFAVHHDYAYWAPS